MGHIKARRLRSIAIAVTILSPIAIAAWFGSHLWMTPNGLSVQVADVSEIASSSPATIAPSVSINPQVALLGTDSSISPDTLQLVLVTTAPGRHSREGTASLGTDPRNPQTYAAGASLANGAVLSEVYRDHIVLELDGKRSVLTIGGQLTGSSDSSALMVGGAEVVTRPLDTFPSSREDMSEVIRPEPFYEREEFAGIKVLPGRNSSRLEVLGLESGDIIRSIEGKPMRSVDAGWQLLDDALSTATSIVVSIERDGTMMSVYLDGSKLAQEPVQASAMAPPPGSPGI